MGDKPPRWPTVQEISESLGGPELEMVKSKARNFGNKALTGLFCVIMFLLYTAACHYSYPLLHKQSYEKAKAYFHLMHEDFLGEAMTEGGDICKDEKSAPIACYYLGKGVQLSLAGPRAGQ